MSTTRETTGNQTVCSVPVYYGDSLQPGRVTIYNPRHPSPFVWVESQTYGLFDAFSRPGSCIATGYDVHAFKDGRIIATYRCRMTGYVSQLPRWLAERRLQSQIKRAAALLAR